MATSSAATIKSIGMHGHWGFSSAFDFVEALINTNNRNDIPDELNFLLVNPGDIRHILCSISKLFRNATKDGNRFPRINFYLLETPVEVLARDLVLLEMFCDLELPVRQRATVFLESFGNMKVQRRTNAYLEILSQRMRHLMAGREKGILGDVLDFSQLRYRERDILEAAFKNYDRSVAMDMDSWFDHRKRGLYEERYDSRKAMFDWDYHAGVKSRASIIHIKQFKHWRETGIAYEFGDQEYVEPNKSMMTFAEGFLKSGKDKGLKKEVMGYWGDIVCSPYFAFGVDCDTPNKFAEGLFEIYNKGTGSEQHRHHAVEVALYQLFSFMWEMETSAVYTLTRANDVYSGLGKAQQSAANATDNLPADMSEAAEETHKSEKVPDKAVEKESDDKDEDGNVVYVDEPAAADADKQLVADSAAVPSKVAPPVDQEAIVAKALDTVEHIWGHLDRVKVYPLTIPPINAEKKLSASSNNTKGKGTDSAAPATGGDEEAAEQKSAIAQLLSKQKFQGLFHGVFVSARYAQLASYPVLSEIMAPSTSSGVSPLLAVETAKHLVPLGTDVKREFAQKIEEFACQRQQMVKCQPVLRRHRDESDTEDDVLFFRTPSAVSS